MKAVHHDGNSALHRIVWMSVYPQEEIFRLLALETDQINRQSKYGMTPLMLAAHKCSRNAIRVLLELGADPSNVNYAAVGPCTALSILLDKIFWKRI
ncbi:ankyrin-2 [Plakobranchus ocellatus]|uniref:Ankyrin-2 n=1 Tax=Plakobranchus ocellatus TaxID=259542 RepID=A0AAV4AP71_9GAST|nr:ankyrin-2 [Plakobranchus ocellatus]